MAEIFGVSFYYCKCSDDIVDIHRKVELTDKQKLEMYYLIKKYLKMWGIYMKSGVINLVSFMESQTDDDIFRYYKKI